MKYYKIINERAIELCSGVPYVSNVSEGTYTQYALSHGYKPMTEGGKEHGYMLDYYRETKKTIVKEWREMELGEAQGQARREVQQR